MHFCHPALLPSSLVLLTVPGPPISAFWMPSLASSCTSAILHCCHPLSSSSPSWGHQSQPSGCHHQLLLALLPSPSCTPRPLTSPQPSPSIYPLWYLSYISGYLLPPPLSSQPLWHPSYLRLSSASPNVANGALSTHYSPVEQDSQPAE
ncbi:uncharacterized protein F5891DRAFT_1195687 [Suillus fuscotomentosus]|uniref:Uncharacterized protein n=1 Tax=Suillus fuscotomentosus TaxID=1912939 RepID=A0AAD4DUG9_9AGAM|nr:uncharacterized protein F5891DRAFT_1195687 [Suillus fuscotomentosus]KAG1893992.1 hypothetical protein F5891DRAFT_1195687 [Suillus fuscotomentosus]